MSKLAIVGASGLVGRNLLEQLQKREFKIDEIFLLGKKSAGSSINFLEKDCRIEDIDEFDFHSLEKTKLFEIISPRHISYNTYV